MAESVDWRKGKNRFTSPGEQKPRKARAKGRLKESVDWLKGGNVSPVRVNGATYVFGGGGGGGGAVGGWRTHMLLALVI